MAKLPPQYNPQAVEETRYQWWESRGLFHAKADPSRKPYAIVIPPPNITGILHMGHALNNTIQDILVRFKRMQGYNTLWVPGTDHAGIATQNVVERALANEGKRRQDLGRDAFVERVWEWKERYGNTIIYQLKRLGASCDWRRTRFTMDEGLSHAVVEVFLRLYKKGLIYRGNYIINWCPRCQTALADEEAPRQETQGKLYHIRYTIEGQGAGGRGQEEPTHAPRPPGPPLATAGADTPHAPAYIEVATTRPETMLGDTAIAVHPKDKRYKALIGKYAILPIVNRALPIIADGLVDRTFGTGAVKVTPAHDPVDFQLGKKHGLEFINVMTDDARMTNVPAPYEGLDRIDCRSKLIVDLEQQGSLGKIDEHRHNVGHCYRCHTLVEPRLSPQWFVKMKPLAHPAIEAVKSGKIRFSPERWTKVYLNWMENIQDWCISRQIWWGHRLPVYYCQTCVRDVSIFPPHPGRKGKIEMSRGSAAVGQSGVIVSKSKPAKCPACGNTDLKQDEDVLDTWFSSWLWPFSTLGWPNKTKDLDAFYPTSTLVTAQEIIFFWVARMIMAGYLCMTEPPFTRVYIHGTVRDLAGKKMSKSLGNIIDPLEIIDQYGTDALRYTLVTATALGQDIFLSEERFTVGRNFANKLWNATRFVLNTAQGSRLQTQREPPASSLNPRAGGVIDRWILSRLQRTITKVTESLDAFLFNEAANTLYDFLWHDFCDWYVEVSKIQLARGSEPKAVAHHPEPGIQSHLSQPLAILVHVLETSLRLLHPIMPFITEELWQHLRSVEFGMRNAESRPMITPHAARRTPHLQDGPSSIMVAPWPKPAQRLIDEEAEAHFERFKAVITAIRNTRAELNVPLESRPLVRLVTKQPKVREFFDAHRPLMQTMAQVGDIIVEPIGQRPKDAAAMVVDGIEVLVPLAGLIDPQQERVRLQQCVDELTKQFSQLDVRLRDKQFTDKAPKDVVAQTKERRAQVRETLKRFSEHLSVLSSL
jgi:valyl-tRNA synthetase